MPRVPFFSVRTLIGPAERTGLAGIASCLVARSSTPRSTVWVIFAAPRPPSRSLSVLAGLGSLTFPPGTDRAVHVDGPVGRLHDLRNRVAHHEPLLTTDVAGRLADLTGLAGRLDPQLGLYLQATSAVANLLATRP